ncbi:MAG: hypothetical protein KIT58_16210 [Planctomycetota bacterium]|nr:hypothetical protein [Planctomycetota bacterium]
MRRSTVVALAGALVVGAFVAGVRADDSINGTYSLSGREKSGGLAGLFGLGPKVTSTLWVSRNADGTFRVARTSSYSKDGQAIGTLTGTGRRSGEVLDVTFPRTTGLSNVLLGERADGPPFKARYTIKRDGKVDGWCEAPARNGSVRRFNESGRRGADAPWPTTGDTATPPTTPTSPTEPGTPTTPTEPGTPTTPTTPDGPLADDVRVDRPVTGRVFLVGQALPFVVVPADATLRIEGPARRDGGNLVITGPGQVTLRAAHAGRTSAPVTIEGITAEVVEVTVEQAIAILDARPPHYRRPLGAPAADGVMEPAAVLKDRPLTVRVTLQASKDLSEPATVRLTGQSGRTRFDGEVAVQTLGRGHAVSVATTAPLTDAVAVNVLDVTWKLADRDAGKTPMRVYTLHGQPVENPMPKYAPAARPVQLVTKLHLELACTWADGATRNDGRGICFKIDNNFAHHVHPRDYRGTPPFVHAYTEGSTPPVNYRDLPGSIQSGGKRSPSMGIYYPPLEPTQDYQEYRHYARNFGWWVLDNPTHTGGRCNQQASLIADMFGTVGIEARVYYIERVARGKQTGRPMRRYYKSSRSSRSWNFHGVTEAVLEGGVKWLYDGSGSYPTRINGQTEDLMKIPNGPFIDFWHPWTYEDVYQSVPQSDWPDTWEGVPLQAGERYP